MSIEVTPRSQVTDLYPYRYVVQTKKVETNSWFDAISTNNLETAQGMADYYAPDHFAVRIIDNQA